MCSAGQLGLLLRDAVLLTSVRCRKRRVLLSGLYKFLTPTFRSRIWIVSSGTLSAAHNDRAAIRVDELLALGVDAELGRLGARRGRVARVQLAWGEIAPYVNISPAFQDMME